MEYKKTGRKMLCTYAGSQFYTKGKLYDEYKSGEIRFVQGSDGKFDPYEKILSKFKESSKGLSVTK